MGLYNWIMLFPPYFPPISRCFHPYIMLDSGITSETVINSVKDSPRFRRDWESWVPQGSFRVTIGGALAAQGPQHPYWGQVPLDLRSRILFWASSDLSAKLGFEDYLVYSEDQPRTDTQMSGMQPYRSPLLPCKFCSYACQWCSKSPSQLRSVNIINAQTEQAGLVANTVAIPRH